MISLLIPAAKRGGRPRTTSMRDAVNAIFYLVRTGGQWRQLPRDFPPWETVYRYFVAWRKSGILYKMQQQLHRVVRISELREPTLSVVIIDSQSVKTGKAGGDRGFDGGKRVKGRKRHLVVDALGLTVDVLVTPANMHDTTGARGILTRIRERTGINLAQQAKRFIPAKKRWLAERTFAWFGDYRRLDKDHERHMCNSTAMIRWAMVRLMLNRLNR